MLIIDLYDQGLSWKYYPRNLLGKVLDHLIFVDNAH